MPLSWNEIKNRAQAFAREWADTYREEADAKPFLDGFFEVLGLHRRKVSTFEYQVKKLDGGKGYIDLLWKGKLLVEMKSRGRNLSDAYAQAKAYMQTLPEHELPRLVLVSDFDHFHLYDMEEGEARTEFRLSTLTEHISLFGRLIGYEHKVYREQDPANVRAAERMGRLHDALKEVGYVGHKLELYLVRVLFLLFAEDTGIFEPEQFQDFVEQRTSPDGSDLAARLGELFQVLNEPIEERLRNLDEQLMAFPYVNGGLFAEPLPIASFDAQMRASLLECCRIDWSLISPAVFGSMFQSVMDAKARHSLGAHYTSEANILRLIQPLFLDELWAEFERVRHQPKRLEAFHRSLSRLRFLDPACGCGNFLIVAYRELRLLELEILKIRFGDIIATGGEINDAFEIDQVLCVQVDQFYGIEYEEFPAQIARVAMWLVDHQMNRLTSETFGLYYARLPLRRSAHIVHADALETDWASLTGGEAFSYIIGNPPFLGSKQMTAPQREQVKRLFAGQRDSGILDYVSAWYIKTARLMQAMPAMRAGLVSTNSIVQGEQVAALWRPLTGLGVEIDFAHRTFRWGNEARGVAAVSCVIVGFSLHKSKPKYLYHYTDPKGQPFLSKVARINPYLVDAETIFVESRNSPLCPVPEMNFGNMPLDGGHLLLTEEERSELIAREPRAEAFIKPLISAREYLNNIPRYCLWLIDATPKDLREMPEVLRRIEAVRQFRLSSVAPSTQKAADRASQFRDTLQPEQYILIPSTTSENREYIPMGFFTKDYIANNSCHIIPKGDLYLFGILMSAMHMAWVRTVCGRLKSDYRYSKKIVYNNFPFPSEVAPAQRKAVEAAATAVLQAREQYPDSPLADLYDPLTMPINLRQAHRQLDRAVERCYRPRPFAGEDERLEYLFARYTALTTAPLSPPKP